MKRETNYLLVMLSSDAFQCSKYVFDNFLMQNVAFKILYHSFGITMIYISIMKTSEII